MHTAGAGGLLNGEARFRVPGQEWGIRNGPGTGIGSRGADGGRREAAEHKGRERAGCGPRQGHALAPPTADGRRGPSPCEKAGCWAAGRTHLP